MTEQDFINQLQGFGEQLSNLDDDLLAIGGRLVSEMRANPRFPVDTGSLRNSVMAVVQDNSINIQMLYYGMFQNYGVAGVDGDSRFGVVDEVPSVILPPPLRSSKYQYKDRAYGIPARRFFNVDELAQRIETELANRITI
jgi:hypothetical protein